MRYWLAFIPFILFACDSGPVNYSAPDDLIPAEKLADIVVDMNLVEAQISEVQLLQHVIQDSVRKYYGELFGKHQINRGQLEASVDYYTTQGGAMDSIYAIAMKKLSAMQLELKDVKMTEDVLTHISTQSMHQLLSDTNLLPMLRNPDIIYPIKHDSVLRYYKTNMNLLDSVETNYRQFGVSLNFYAGNKIKLEKLLVKIDKG